MTLCCVVGWRVFVLILLFSHGSTASGVPDFRGDNRYVFFFKCGKISASASGGERAISAASVDQSDRVPILWACTEAKNFYNALERDSSQYISV